MNNIHTLHFIVVMLAIFLTSCGKTESNDNIEGSQMAESNDLTVEVDTMIVKAMPFKNDIMSNGRIKAAEFADVYFRTNELISEVMVHNGQRVKKGQPLARLDMFKLNAEKARQTDALDKARLDLKDVLIGQGYDTDNMDAVPAEVMNLARVRSGLEQAELSYNSAIWDLENATLTAPFDGVVANVKGARHTMASPSEPFCRVINDYNMSVEFPILESELTNIKPGESVEVIPFSSNRHYNGYVTEINPIVDDHGQITVKAVLNGANDGLIDGVNVRIRSSHNLSDRLIVPKRAVVLRTNRQVVFTFENGKAMWNYVTTGLENFDSYEILDGLSEGMAVIVDGNENLAHETPVKIKSSKLD